MTGTTMTNAESFVLDLIKNMEAMNRVATLEVEGRGKEIAYSDVENLL